MKLLRKLENLFAASAFAEAGEFDTAREIASEEVKEQRRASKASNIKSTRPDIVSGSRSLKGAGSKS